MYCYDGLAVSPGDTAAASPGGGEPQQTQCRENFVICWHSVLLGLSGSCWAQAQPLTCNGRKWPESGAKLMEPAGWRQVEGIKKPKHYG